MTTQKTLKAIAAKPGQELLLRRSLYALRDNVQIERLAQCHDCRNNRCVFGVACEITDKPAVDFQFAGR
jgi:hypothetical protein